MNNLKSTEEKPIIQLFKRMKALGHYRQYRNYADYIAQNRLEKVREVNCDDITRSTEGAVGFKKQRPMFGYSD